MFEVVVAGGAGFSWSEPPVKFSDRESAYGHARGILGRIVKIAPDDTEVTVLDGETVVAVWSVVSWRTAIWMIGDKAYGPRP